MLASPAGCIVIAVYISVQLGYCFGLSIKPGSTSCIGGVRVFPDPGDRRPRGGQYPLSPMVPAGRRVRLAVMWPASGTPSFELATRTGAKIRKSLDRYLGVLPAVRLDAVGGGADQ